MKNILASMLLIAAALLMVNVCSAHTRLASSSPDDGEVLSESPKQLELQFVQAARLMKLALKDDAGKEVDIGFQPMAEASKKAVVKIPELQPGKYIVQWNILGADGHKMVGSFHFIVE